MEDSGSSGDFGRSDSLLILTWQIYPFRLENLEFLDDTPGERPKPGNESKNMQTPLTLDSLGELDNGAARAIVDHAIRTCVQDLDDRGEDEKPRKVVIDLEMVKLDNGLTAAHVSAKVVLPPRRTASTVAVIRNQGGQPGLLFQTLAPDDPHQRTLDEVEGHS